MLVNYQKEINDIFKLSQIIKNDNWISDNLIIVNCSPDYSSICCQVINHDLSKINNNELFEQISLEMPYPTSNIIFDREKLDYENFSRYLYLWNQKYISKDYKYLFIDSGTLRGVNFSKLRSIIKDRCDFKLASLYVQDNSILTPDYYVEKFNFEKQGGLIFEWENPKNPNWNY